MTIITISDDLKRAIDQAFPNERIDAVVERLLREAVAERPKRTPEEVEAILAKFERVRESTRSLSDDEIRQFRHEGRK